MFELTIDEKKALDWALNQEFCSVAAQHSKVLAKALERAIKELECIQIKNQNNSEYMCDVCHKVPVDVSDGYDTCSECASKI